MSDYERRLSRLEVIWSARGQAVRQMAERMAAEDGIDVDELLAEAEHQAQYASLEDDPQMQALAESNGLTVAALIAEVEAL